MAIDEKRERDVGPGRTLPTMPLGRARDVLARARSGVAGAAAPALAARAAGLGAPLVVIAQTSAARVRLARALHALVGRDGPLVIAGAPLAGDAGPGTMLLDVELSGDADTTMVAECIADDGEPWLLLGAGTGDDAMAAIGMRLGAPSIEWPVLDVDAVAPTAREVLRALEAPGGETPSLEAEATTWLAERPAMRDPETLAATLRRALLLAGPGEAIAVRHLAPVAAAPLLPRPAPSVPPAPPPAADARLEYVLAELAHELRNPLVTLKTVADHLDELAADAELRGRFVPLAGEAVARMDALLDNLVTYGRLGAPVAAPVDLAALLDAVLQDAEPTLARRHLTVRASTGGATCLADPGHLGFAMRNLVAGVAEAAAPDGELVVDATANGILRLRFASDADAATLRRLLVPDGGDALYDPTCQPLPFSLARAVLEQVGGRVEVTPAGEGGTALEVRLPVPDRQA
jgi:hypothetical protein